MTDEELDRARASEAIRLSPEYANVPEMLAIAARLAREGWMPPDPLEAAFNELTADTYGHHCLYSQSTMRERIRKALERGIELGKQP